MNQCQLNHAVSRLTGEPLRHIRSVGFSFVPAPTLPQRRRWHRPQHQGTMRPHDRLG